jgi:lipopolysaccharide transport system ATP-binding protein
MTMEHMKKTAIAIENLSKRYRIGVEEESHETLIGAFGSWVRSPLRNFRYLRSLSRVGQGEEHDAIWALRDINLDIKQGDVVGLIGRNGAGKSTLLKIISRITRPSSGRVVINGRVASLLEVGTGFHPDLTGRENAYLNGAILGMTKREIDAKFDEIVSFAEVEKFIDTPVKRYSSGMRVRLAFAVAAHLEPEILVVDEVLAVGDLQFQKKCLGRMQDVATEGRTVLFVSHNMSTITRLCTTGVLLHEGKVVSTGRASEVVAEYLSESLGASAVAEWDDMRSPGSNGFKLRALRLIDSAGKPSATVHIERTVKLEIEYELTQPLAFRCAARFYTEGVCAFTVVEPTEVEHSRTGIYRTSVTIPGNLLAEGEYLVSVSVFSSRGRKIWFCRVKEALAFQVFDPIEGTSARGDYAETMGGVLRPLLEWNEEYVGHDEMRPRLIGRV